MEAERLEKLKAFMDENKGKRKFAQSVELAINFSGINFGKAENRLNMEVRLPNGRGKVGGAIVFADDKLISERAAQSGAAIINSSELQAISTDKARLSSLLKSELLAQPSLMPMIAKSLGQFLGPRNKMPKPLLGSDVAGVIKNVSNSIYIRSKGKYLPTVHCIAGKENMEIQQIVENIDQIINTVVKKVGKQNVKSVYVKLTMSKPMRLI
jgi:large subunit ribosomal protein L1